MTLVQTKPNVTFLLLQQNFQLKFSFKSYFFKKCFITRLISTATAIPKPLTNETEKSTMLPMVTQ